MIDESAGGRASTGAERSRVLALLVAAVVAWGATSAAGEEFAEDRDDMLRELLVDPAPTEGVRGTSKSLTLPGGTRSVPVMREGSAESKNSRVIGVVERRREAPRVNLKVEFAHDSDALDAGSRRLLRQLSEALSDPSLAGEPISINGHTDASGPEDYNLELSFRRARSVRDFLVGDAGLDESRFTVLGFGEAVPLNANATSAERGVNRRVEVERLP